MGSAHEACDRRVRGAIREHRHGGQNAPAFLCKAGPPSAERCLASQAPRCLPGPEQRLPERISRGLSNLRLPGLNDDSRQDSDLCGRAQGHARMKMRDAAQVRRLPLERSRFHPVLSLPSRLHLLFFAIVVGAYIGSLLTKDDLGGRTACMYRPPRARLDSAARAVASRDNAH